MFFIVRFDVVTDLRQKWSLAGGKESGLDVARDRGRGVDKTGF